MKQHIYLDSSATTPVRREVINMMNAVTENEYGNPSSLHRMGFKAEKIIDHARGNILRALKINSFQNARLIFCGSGTEANNLAVFGTVNAKNKNMKHIITTDSEHPSVLEPINYLESENVRVTKISTKYGVINLDELRSAIRPETILISIMLVNNETGAVYSVGEAFSAAKKINPAIVTHCDAVQGFGKIDFSPLSYNADLATISAHKLNGPKGIGALYCNKSVIASKRLIPHIFGGGQEKGFRSGTENTVGIVGFGEAVKYSMNIGYVTSLRNHLIGNLSSEVIVNVPKQYFVPHIINITLPRIKSETMLHYLSGKGIYVSSGSACSSNGSHLSNTLLNFGLDGISADCSLRISLSDDNTVEQLDRFLAELNKGLNELVRF